MNKKLKGEATPILSIVTGLMFIIMCIVLKNYRAEIIDFVNQHIIICMILSTIIITYSIIHSFICFSTKIADKKIKDKNFINHKLNKAIEDVLSSHGIKFAELDNEVFLEKATSLFDINISSELALINEEEESKTLLSSLFDNKADEIRREIEQKLNENLRNELNIDNDYIGIDSIEIGLTDVFDMLSSHEIINLWYF